MFVFDCMLGKKKILDTDLLYTSQHTSELSRGSKPIMLVDGSPLM